MSEPASLIVQCQITFESLRQCLAANTPRISGWSDWEKLDIIFEKSEWPEIERHTAKSTGNFIKELRHSAEHPADWGCAYDRESQTLTIGKCLFSDSWPHIISTLAILRRLEKYISPEHDRGLILIYDWVFQNQGAMAAISLFPGGSEIIPPETLGQNYDEFAAQILSPIRDAIDAGGDEPIRDDLDLLIGQK